MQDVRFFPAELLENKDLGAGNRLLHISLPDDFPAASVRPGQFVMVRGPWDRHPMLPRAFSILSARANVLELLVKEVGRGTRLLAALAPGARVTVLGPLGTPFPAPAPGVIDVLVGGGSGIPPLTLHAIRVQAAGLPVHVIYGGRSAADLVLLERLRRAALTVIPCTEDGSLGERGRVTDVLRHTLEDARDMRVLACGPTGMLKAVAALCAAREVPCLVSLETEMACGIGLCRGCSVTHRDGGYRCTCVDGPVFDAAEVIL